MRCLIALDAGHMAVIGTASNGAQAVEMALALHPDLVLMDYAMPGKCGVEATREIRSADPNLVVVSYSIYEDERLTKTMLEAGAAFHVSKHTDNAVLLVAIRKHGGGSSPESGLPTASPSRNV